MKRFFLLLVAVLLYMASVAFSCSIRGTEHLYSPRSIIYTVGTTQWILHLGALLRFDRHARVAISSEDVYRDSNAVVLFSSKNSPLVQGAIDRVLIDDEDRLIAISARGEVSIFNGREWTLPRIAYKAHPDEKYHIGIRDVKQIGGVIYFITQYGVQRIDKHRNEIQRVSAFPERMTSARFLPSGELIFFTKSFHGTIDVELGRMDLHETKDHDTLLCRVFQQNRERQSIIINLLKKYQLVYDSADACRVRVEETELSCGFAVRSNNKLVVDMCTDRHGNIYLATTEGVRVIKAPPFTGINVADPTSSSAVVYPNPATTVATLKLDADPKPGTMANIVDIMGRVVRSLPLERRMTELDVNGLKGAYRIVVVSPSMRTTLPLLVTD